MNTPKVKPPPMPVVSTAPEGKHQFWMVYVGGMNQPKMKFEFFADAVKSAKHLCRQNRSRKVYVLESVGVFEPEWMAFRQAAKKDKPAAGMQDPAAEIEMLKLARERAIDAADVVQDVEEERDELRRDVAAILKALPNGAHDATEGVVSIQAMRAAISEAHDAFEDTLAIARIKWGNRDPDANTVFENASAALAKLKPFMP